MKHLACFVSFFLLISGSYARATDLGVKWEAQLRPWVPGVQKELQPDAVIRYFPGGGAREELLALYEVMPNEFVILLAETREINAQAYENVLRAVNVEAPIPVRIRTRHLSKVEGSRFRNVLRSFLLSQPPSWKWLAQMGHGGSLFGSTKDSNYLYEGPIDVRSEKAVSSVYREVAAIHKLLRPIRPISLFEFPQVKELIQWRFMRALIQGDEPLAIHLLSLGASPNKDSPFFQTPVEYAIGGNLPRLLEALVNRGADLQEPTSGGSLPLEFAIELKAKWAYPFLTRAAGPVDPINR